ncbi:MAG: AAA family ATPase [Arcicella sp.]|nr:AAA family ATPase [Arcicella sp.]
MYIKHLAIENLKSISKFEMDFPKPAGWHVIIGDNGAGKTSVAQGVALGLNGSEESAFKIDWERFVKKNQTHTSINMNIFLADNDFIFKDREDDCLVYKKERSGFGLGSTTFLEHEINKLLEIYDRQKIFGVTDDKDKASLESRIKELSSNDELNIGWFFAGFGPFRRFTGGEYDKNLEISNPRASAVISLFDEKYTLSEALNWLRELNYKKLEGDTKSETTLKNLVDFLNNSTLLPFGTKLTKVSSEGVFFTDAQREAVEINQLSDGFRSILSLAFELIRLLIRFYDEEKVFKNFKKGNYLIDLPGVVIIDEIDAHLHPTWQTRVGQWFTKYFPALQFIVTTHSPLVCRAAENGSIWRLAAPGSKIPSGEITGADKDRLVYGNILDAYGTDAFGENLERSEEGFEKLKRYSYLSQKAVYDPQHLSKEDKEELSTLEKIFVTDATFAL